MIMNPSENRMITTRIRNVNIVKLSKYGSLKYSSSLVNQNSMGVKYLYVKSYS